MGSKPLLEFIDKGSQTVTLHRIRREVLGEVSQVVDDDNDIELAAVKIATIAASSEVSIDIALQWIPSIKTTQLQYETQQRVIKSWYSYDQHSALEYLDQTESLTFQQKTIINNALTKIPFEQ